MAEGGREKGFDHCKLTASDDGDLVHSILIGSQEDFEFICQPCDMDNNQVEATFYCKNCEEYLCEKCSTSHKKFQQIREHDIVDKQHITDNLPISKRSTTRSCHENPAHAATASTRAVTIATTSGPGKSCQTASSNPTLASTGGVTMATTSGPGNYGHSASPNPAPSSTRAVIMATHVKDIKFDKYTNIVSSALMSTNQLLIAIEWFNSKVILVDTISGRQVSEMKLSGRPGQVAKINDTEAAVTLCNDKTIVLLRTQPQLSVVRNINVKGKCFGIAYMDSRLIVTFKGGRVGRVGILDMSGKVLRTISVDQSGKKIFTVDPEYVTVDPTTGSMYVSNWDIKRSDEGKLVKLSKNGSVEATYNGGGDPKQVVLGSQGMVYVVCDGEIGLQKQVWVDQLTTNCDLVKSIIFYLSPRTSALSYDEATQQLYVGHYNGVVKVYKLNS